MRHFQTNAGLNSARFSGVLANHRDTAPNAGAVFCQETQPTSWRAGRFCDENGCRRRYDGDQEEKSQSMEGHMSDSPGKQITELLDAASQGDAEAHQTLWSLIYTELHTLAKRQMVSEKPGRTLQPTALVHEAYMRLLGNGAAEWANRRQFFAAAANVMRHIRVDDARMRKRLKRGGGEQPRELIEGLAAVFEQDPTEVLAVDEALKRLQEKDHRKAEIVQLRYFAGMTVDETAAALEVSSSTVEKEWRLAKAWLYRELAKGDTHITGNE
jgi:RNA polymerase sigma-70 factor (ECF subfamily)